MRLAKSLAFTALLCAAACPSVHAQQPEKQSNEQIRFTPCPITRLALFKNGIGAVSRTLTTSQPGPIFVNGKISPIHGTLWFDRADGISVRSTRVPVDEPNTNPFANLTDTYENKIVTLQLRSANQNPRIITGTVVRAAQKPDSGEWDRNYDPLPYSYNNRMNAGTIPSEGNFITLKLASGTMMSISRDLIESIESQGINQSVRNERDILVFDTKSKQAGSLTFSYLTKGIAWAPAYKLVLGKDSKMQIEMSATVRNELESVKDVEMLLVSGFPNITFSNVNSLLSPGMTLASFFQQLSGGQGGNRPAPMVQKIMMNSARFGGSAESDDMMMPPGTSESAESADLNFYSLGKVSIKAGDSMYFSLGSKDAEYEKIVEWTIPDRRDPYGGNIQRNYGDGKQESPFGTPWDAIRFKNPFTFPMTTAPADIHENGRFLGQTMTEWVNPGAENTLKITKALSITVKATENEVDKPRSTVSIGGYNYRQPEVEGVLTIKNYRKTDAKMIVKLQFSGELISADASPKKELREEGVYSINKRNELKWEIIVKPEEELTLKYKYSVLVRH